MVAPASQPLQFCHINGNCGPVMAGRLDFRRQAVVYSAINEREVEARQTSAQWFPAMRGRDLPKLNDRPFFVVILTGEEST